MTGQILKLIRKAWDIDICCLYISVSCLQTNWYMYKAQQVQCIKDKRSEIYM